MTPHTTHKCQIERPSLLTLLERISKLLLLLPGKSTQSCSARGGRCSSLLEGELRDALLEEADDLVGGSNAGIVVGLNGLCAHLLLGEDDPLSVLVSEEGLDLLGIARSDVAKVAEVRSVLQQLQEISLVHDLLPGSVDESAALWHLGQQVLVDGLLGLRSEWHMQRHVLSLEQISHSVNRLGTSRLDGFLGDVWIVGVGLHAESLCQLEDSPGNCTEAIEGNGSTHKLEATGAVVVVSGTCDHHAEHELRDRIGILSWRVHGHDALGMARWECDVVVSGTCSHDELQLRRLVNHSLIHNVTADDHRICICNGRQQVFFGLVVLQLLQGVVPSWSRLEDFLNLLYCVFGEGLLCCQKNCPCLACLSSHRCCFYWIWEGVD
mmetsp:Transcript_13841/g.32655  ORF Transcript_13841/g.32655 Transcript_13841/m.32655 type:complete len:380 (-) Transcript_13841:53-1192(-)